MALNDSVFHQSARSRVQQHARRPAEPIGRSESASWASLRRGNSSDALGEYVRALTQIARPQGATVIRARNAIIFFGLHSFQKQRGFVRLIEENWVIESNCVESGCLRPRLLDDQCVWEIAMTILWSALSLEIYKMLNDGFEGAEKIASRGYRHFLRRFCNSSCNDTLKCLEWNRL